MQAIMTGDPKALEKLQEKLRKMEADREFMKSINKDFKQAKGDVTKMTVIPEGTRQNLIDIVEKAHSWEKQPYPSWKISNLGTNIRTVKKRIEKLKPKADKIAVKKKVDYVGEAIKRHGAFFAFSTEQFEEQRVEGVAYTLLEGFSGLVTPSGTCGRLVADINKASVQAVLDDMETNTNKEIIWRELANHEAQYTGSIESTIDALKGYEITAEEVQAEFGDFCKSTSL